VRSNPIASGIGNAGFSRLEVMPSPTMLRKAPLVLTVLVNLTVHKALETVAKPIPTVQEKLFPFHYLTPQ